MGAMASVWLFACDSPSSSAPSQRAENANDSPTLPEAQFQVQSPVLEQKDDQGRLLWRLKAEVLEGEAKSGEAQGTLKKVQGWLYRDGKPVLEFSAPFARADSERKEVVAWGGMRARSRANRAELEAGRIVWRAREDRIYASEGVRLHWGEFELREKHLVVDTALERAWGAP